LHIHLEIDTRIHNVDSDLKSNMQNSKVFLYKFLDVYKMYVKFPSPSQQYEKDFFYPFNLLLFDLLHTTSGVLEVTDYWQGVGNFRDKNDDVRLMLGSECFGLF